MRSLLSRALILLGLTAIAFAQADPIQAALDKKDFATAFKLLKPLSDQGDAEAQAVLAHKQVRPRQALEVASNQQRVRAQVRRTKTVRLQQALPVLQKTEPTRPGLEQIGRGHV